MKRLFQTAGLTLLLLISAGTSALADVKIKSKSTSAGQTSEHVMYIKGKRQRTENNPLTVTIMQCDQRRTIDLSEQTKTYVVTSFDARNAPPVVPARRAEPASASTSTRRGGLVTTTITTTDTGERKTILGYTARRIKSTMVTESSPDACQQTHSRMEMDGWYIDAAFALDCMDGAFAAYVPPSRPDGCQDEYRMKQVGTAKIGYPVMLTTTMFDEAGKPNFTWTQEVLEISKAVLDDALFDIPTGYRQVKDRQEMYSASAMMSAAAASGDDDTDSPATNAGATLPLGGNSSNTANSGAAGVAEPGAKKQGVIRVGVPLTTVAATGDGVNAQALGEAMRNSLVGYLSGPAVEVVALEARVPQEIEAEAARKECDYVLYSSAAHKKGGSGGFGGFLKKAATGMATGVSGSVKSKDELTLEYTLQSASGATTPLVTKTIRAKAKSDGEDLISQLSGQAAADVLAVATRK